MKNHLFPSLQPKGTAKPNGFALVATLMLMLLLGILAIGMLSLSSISLRSSSQNSAVSEARGNARMALMLAIGELQRNTGSDTRITAPADIVEAGAPPLTGVWKSWEGTNHDSTGRPVKPDYTVKTKSETDSGRFLTWLVSGAVAGNNPSVTGNKPSDLVATTTSAVTVPLLAGGTLGSNPGQVHVKPQLVKNNTGAIAWWVSPENQKARLIQPHKPRTDDVAGWVEMGQSHTGPDPEPFGLAALLADPENYTPDPSNPKAASKALTLGTAKFIAVPNPANPQQNFHDLSTSASGLLTNTATGGWRKDLSILTEKWDAIYNSYPGGKLPLFRFNPTSGSAATSQVPKPRTSAVTAHNNPAAVLAATPAQSSFYPWSESSLILGYTQPGTYHAASASWESLVSFATSYKNFTYSSGVVKSPFVWDRVAKQDVNSVRVSEIYNHKHKQLLHPQIARFQFLVYVTAVEDPARLNLNPKRYQMRLMYVPFFTLWNPYNVTLERVISGTLNGGQNSGTEKNFLGFGWRRSLPGVMAIVSKATYPIPDPNLIPINQYRMFSPGNFQTLDWPNNNANLKDNALPGNVAKYGGTQVWRGPASDSWGFWLPEGTLTLKPGEAKIFSIDTVDTGYGFGGNAFRLKEGYNPTNIVGSSFNHLSNLLATQSYWFLFKNDRLTQPYRARAPGSGFSLSFGDGGSHFGGTAVLPSAIGDEFHNITSLATGSVGDKYWPPGDLDEVGYSVGELVGQWIPIYSVSFGPRMTIGTGAGTKQNRPTKGVLQNDALAAMVLSEPDSGKAKDHPANNTFDFAYHSMSIGSNITPNLSASEGYIATGYQSGDGLSRLIVDEIPLKPMASLVELQGWNPRGHNPYPPFQMNLIGNSDATPLIPNDSVVPPTLTPPPPNPNPRALTDSQVNLQHDDAYCANHLLFDDWFVSSIAPKPVALGGNIAQDITAVYKEYLIGNSRLTNRAYKPIAEDASMTVDSAIAARVAQIVNSPTGDGWLKVASRFEVEGMFNVNSTSIPAWKALLGHAKSRGKLAQHGASGIVSATADKNHPVTRGAIATDVEAGSGPAIGGGGPNGSEYTGFRSLSDAEIEDLAKKIVDQVRLRGPFLSLSEFVNRQLSTNDGLALAGAVQTAINNLADDPMKKLRDPANSLSATTMPASDPKLIGVNYEYGKAAEGSSAYGVPGWIRQADILRPIAPILSARDDTFTIRAYGDARDANGNVVAKAWCEATVQRSRNFVDTLDAADSVNPPASVSNMLFGRRYEVVTFRWLSPDEV